MIVVKWICFIIVAFDMIKNTIQEIDSMEYMENIYYFTDLLLMITARVCVLYVVLNYWIFN